MRIPVRRRLASQSLKHGELRGDDQLTLDEEYEMMIWLNMHSET